MPTDPSLTAFQWFSIIQTVVMAAVTGVIFLLRHKKSVDVDDARLHDRVQVLETEVGYLRKWRHEVIVPWQTKLLLDLDERYWLRREVPPSNDSPWPNNRRKPR